LAGLVGATITVFLSRGQSPSAIILLSLTIFAAAAVGFAALRTFLPLTTRTSTETTQVIGGRTRTAIWREKTLVLRSIKELEFDRDMGKVSEKDFAEMSARLRARATRLLRQLDAGVGYRAEIEREIEKRLGMDVTMTSDPAKVGGSKEQDPPYTVSPSTAREASGCSSCGTRNDADARFCKNCGNSLEARS
jgi:hypothetical protein